MSRYTWLTAALFVLGSVAEATAGPKDNKAAGSVAPPLTEASINDAVPSPSVPPVDAERKEDSGKSVATTAPDPLVIKLQILLDRARFSPGAIDGRTGANLRGALSAFVKANDLPTTETPDRAVFDKLQAAHPEPALRSYTITEDDAKGPFDSIPKRMEDQAAPQAMGYTNAREMLAERFHMQRDLLSTLNQGKAFDKAGTVITVAAVTPIGDGKVENAPLTPKVTRVEVDKANLRVRAYGEDEALIATYPASIGSSEKPAPTGTFTVKSATFDPWYTYNPKYSFKGVRTRRKFSIKPGPNNPVGLVWIDLSAESYGIHGTPEPENVGKTESHGCIRLTNWDARDLASHVNKGAKVVFLTR